MRDPSEPLGVTIFLVRVAGLEPTTSSFQVKHSTRLSYTLIVLDAPRGLEPQFLESKSSVLPLDEGAKIGEGTESRTPYRLYLAPV